MKYKILIFIFGVIIQRTFSTPLGDCEIDDDGELKITSTGIFKASTEDVTPFKASFSYTGDLVLNLAAVNDEETGADYVDISANDNQLTFGTNDYFISNFETDNVDADPSPSIIISRTVELKCGEEKQSIVFSLTVKDTNNHEPTFDQQSYNYVLPSPLTPSIDLTSVGDSITVHDLDFSNTDITFTVDPATYFTVESVKDNSNSSDKRAYKGILKVKQYLRFSNTINLTLTATDNGTPPRTSKTAAVQILPDPNNSLQDIPKFSQSLYRFKYSKDDGLKGDTDIKIEATDTDLFEVALLDDQNNISEYFKAEYTSSTVTISPTDTSLPASSDPVLVLTLTATPSDSDDEATAVILIELDQELVVKAPTFSKPYYRATYKVDGDEHSLEADDVTVSEGADVTIEGDTTHFKLEKVDDAWKLNIAENLTDAELKEGEPIILTLTANVIDQDENILESKSIMIVDLPQVDKIQVPRFARPLYVVNYTVDDEGNGEVNIDDIDATSDGQTVEIKIKSSEPSDGTDYFELINEKNKWSINVKKNLSEKILSKGAEYVLIMEATVSGNDDVESGYSTVVITVPASGSAQQTKFSKIYYTAEYKVGSGKNNDAVEVTNANITLENGEDITPIIEENDYSSYFTLTYDSSNKMYLVQVKEKLPQDITETLNEIILTLSVDQSENKASSVLIIELPKTVIPVFSEPYYEATYEIDENNVVSLPVSIEITSPSDQDVVVSFKDDNKNFNLYLDKKEYKWKINVTKNLSADDYKQKILIYTLEASIDGNDGENVGTAILIIHLPKTSPTSQFSTLVYNAEYSLDEEGNPTVDILDGPISVNSADSVEIVDKQSNFKLVQNDDATGYSIEVEKKLDDETLLTEADLVLTLQAKTTDLDDVGTAVVIIMLPKSTTPLAFTQPLYKGDYDNTDQENPSVTLDSGIELNFNFETVSVSLETPQGFEDNFELSKDSPYTIEVTNPLNKTILTEGLDIILNVIASSSETTLATAPVIISLPPITKAPKFSKPTYQAKYVENDEGGYEVQTIDEISTDADDDAVTVTVEEPYDSNFDISYKDGGYVVTVTSELDLTSIEQPVIYVALKAKLADSDSDSATLAIKLPEKTESIIPTFSEVLYYADYLEDNSITEISPEITITSDKASDTVVKVTGDYAKYFDINLEDNSWTLDVAENLPDSVINENSEIYLPLQANLEGSAGKGIATLILGLPKRTELKATPKFSRPTYFATYSVDDSTDEASIEDADSIQITSKCEPQVVVSLQNYTSNFKLTRNETDMIWTLEILDDLDSTVLENNNELVLSLVAHLDNSESDGVANLIVKLPSQEEEIIAFDNNFYTATYQINDDLDTLEMDPITVTKDTTVDITSENYRSYFKIVEKDEKYIVEVEKNLADEILEKETDIILTLQATRDGVSSKGQATVLITLPLQEKAKAPEFAQVIYSTNYDDDSKTITPVTVKVQGDVTDVTVAFDEDAKIGDSPVTDYFDITKKSDDWEITSKKELPSDILTEGSSVSFVLEASKASLSTTGKTALVIQLPQEQVSKSFNFKDTVYMADYKVNGDTSTLDFSQPISITGETSGVKLVVSEYKDKFIATLDSDGTVTVEPNGLLDSDTLESEVAITLNLKATKDSEEDEATIVIRLPRKVSPTSIYFEKRAYMASYQSDPPTFDVDDDIVLVNYDPDVEVALAGDNAKYFKIDTTDDGKVIVELDGDSLPTEDFDESVISVEIRATYNDETTTTLVVVKLPTTESSSFWFDEPVYIANYAIVDADSPVLSHKTAIKLGGTYDGVEVSLSGDYAKYFDAAISDGVVELKLADENSLIENVGEPTISVDIVATKNNEKTTSKVVITLPDTIAASFLFEDSVYMADYEYDTSDSAVLKLENPIKLTGTLEDIAVGLSGDYSSNFNADYDLTTGEVSVTLKSEIEKEILESEIAVTITVEASNELEKQKAVIIVKLPKKIAQTDFYFEKLVYEGEYKTSDDSANITLEDILLLGDVDATASVEIQGDYKDYFGYTRDETNTDKIIVTLTKDLQNDIIEKESFVAFDLVAEKEEENTTTKVIVKLPPKVVSTSFYFNDISYMADYTVDDNGKGKISLSEPINLSGDTEGVEVSLEDTDMEKYFNVKYNSDQTITITTSDPLSNDFLKEPVITINIVATKGDEEKAKATIVTKINDYDDNDDDSGPDKTGLIAAIAALAVLLVASLVGSAVFYYFKFRRGGNFVNMESPRQTFRKNSNSDAKRKIEHPTRRPTGVIKYDLNGADENNLESFTDEEKITNTDTIIDDDNSLSEKKKSVQFDTINIDELEIEKTVDDIDDNDVNNESPYENLDIDSNNERRTSSV